MLIHLSKFEFHSKGKQIIAAQNIENKNSTSTQGKESLVSLTYYACSCSHSFFLPPFQTSHSINSGVLESYGF